MTLRHLDSHPDPTTRLRVFAQLECALADWWNPHGDDLDERHDRLLAASLAAARQLCDSSRVAWPPLLARLASILPPASTTVSLSTWEGLEFYALFPARYRRAAWSWKTARPGRSAWVIGLRSMGSILAPTVAAQLQLAGTPIRLSTLRPRGAPHHRAIRLSPRWQDEVRAWCGDFLLVDEGPGLSGTSLSGAIAGLAALGVDFSRIVLTPAWDPSPPSFPDPRTSALWSGVARHPAAPLAPPASGLIDISGGRWRSLFPSQRRVPVWATHERAKFFDASTNRVVRFLGIGRAAGPSLLRAHLLAEAGFIPTIEQCRDGWMQTRVLRAAPLGRDRSELIAWAAHAGRYLGFRAQRFPLGPPSPPSQELQRMLAVNLDILRIHPPPPPPDGVPVALDARMLPQEWGRTTSGWIKFDALDHFDDPFFPGPCDIAWDLATVELEFGREAGGRALAACIAITGDSALPARLPWYRLACLAFRIGFCRLAATQAGATEAPGFAALERRYLGLLHRFSFSSGGAAVYFIPGKSAPPPW